jgi:hypothetical protein
MKYTSILATAAVVAGLATPALAGEPTGTYNFKTNGTYDQSNVIGRDSSQITQNGQFVGGNHGAVGDQTTDPGSRAAIVQGLQASQGRGSVNSGK